MPTAVTWFVIDKVPIAFVGGSWGFLAIEFGGVVSALSFSTTFWRECDCEVMGLSGEV